MSHIPPTGTGSMMPPGFGMPAGIPSYPGTPQLNAAPLLQFNPVFDGNNYHGTQSVPYVNSLLEDVNSVQDAISAQNGLGYPPFPPSALPPFGAAPMPGAMPPAGGVPTNTGGAAPTHGGAAPGPSMSHTA